MSSILFGDTMVHNVESDSILLLGIVFYIRNIILLGSTTKKTSQVIFGKPFSGVRPQVNNPGTLHKPGPPQENPWDESGPSYCQCFAGLGFVIQVASLKVSCSGFRGLGFRV